MSSIHRMRVFRTVAVTGAMILLATSASAGVESSCPDPCVRLPKSALFVRETNGTLDQNNKIVSLSGTLLKGTAKTVLRLDVSLMVHAGAGMGGVYFFPFLNGEHPSIGYGQEIDGHEISCDPSKVGACSVTGSFWFDIDALEAVYPGMFVGQPLTIEVTGGTLPSGAGEGYRASFSAEVVKKK